MWYLAVDIGTRATKAARVLDGVVEPLALAGRPELPSAVFLAPDGTVIGGWPALDLGAVHPDRLEETPRRWLANGSTMVIGGTVVPVVDALEAILAVVVADASATIGTTPGALALTHPASWSASRQQLLIEAATRVGVPLGLLVAEPVAAAAATGGSWGDYGHIAVMDLGAGTLGCAVVRRGAEGLEVVGAPGGHERMGGEVFDERFGHLVGRRIQSDDPHGWELMADQDSMAALRARQSLRTQVRQAREQLSSATATHVAVPSTGRSVPVSREDLDAVISAEVHAGADALEATVRHAGLDMGSLGSVVLVGGAAGTPLVHWTMVARHGERLVADPDLTRLVAVGAARLLVPDATVPATTAAAFERSGAAPGPQVVPAAPFSTVAGVGWAPARPPAAPTRPLSGAPVRAGVAAATSPEAPVPPAQPSSTGFALALIAGVLAAVLVGVLVGWLLSM